LQVFWQGILLTSLRGIVVKSAQQLLNEFLQRRGKPAAQFSFERWGDDHEPTFTATVSILGKEFVGETCGTKQSAKEARQPSHAKSLVFLTKLFAHGAAGLIPVALFFTPDRCSFFVVDIGRRMVQCRRVAGFLVGFFAIMILLVKIIL
jgi:hypothetical protein